MNTFLYPYTFFNLNYTCIILKKRGEIMVSGTIEILATILIVIMGIKFLVLAINPKKWFSFAESLYKNVKAMQIISLILAGVILYYLLQAGITITQIFAIMLFLSFLMMMQMAPFVKKLMKLFKPKDVFKENWLPVIIWIVLLLWAIKEIFM